ncbi:MAG: 2-oxoacid:acceptor oxidoreductase family protein [Candidatus Limnocylindrales bacterium]|jgi:indolepyruvate ferredoxin oxidoreductase beta subunit
MSAAEGPGKVAAVTNVVLAGLGGQGVIKASDILADAALRGGLDVKKSEIHGMSQRGGSVTSDVRFGARVLSPMVPQGEADYLVVLAPSEVEVVRAMLRPGGVLLAPELIPDAELPNKRSLNVALLGALSTYLDLPPEAMLEAVRAALPGRLHAVNAAAFELGRRVAAGSAGRESSAGRGARAR